MFLLENGNDNDQQQNEPSTPSQPLEPNTTPIDISRGNPLLPQTHPINIGKGGKVAEKK